MQALGLLPKQSWRPFSHHLESRSFTARALSSSTLVATLQSRTIRSLSCSNLKGCPPSVPITVFAWRRRDKPAYLPARFVSNSRREVPNSRKEGTKPDDSIGQRLGSSRASVPLEANQTHIPTDPEPKNSERNGDDGLVYVVDLHRNKLVIWSLIAVFVTVYVLGLPLRDGNRSQEPAEPPRERLLEEPKEDESFTHTRQSIVPALAVEKLAFQVKNWPPGPNYASWYPYVTSMFAHGSIIHLGFNCYGFYQLSSYLMCTPIGIGGTLAVWFFGGLTASQLSCFSQKSYAKGDSARGGWYSKLFKKESVDPNPARTLNAYNLGASGGLMSMMAVIAIWRGGSLWGLPLIPIPIQARVVGLLIFAWDFYGNYYNSPDGIGHNAHLCGMGVGAGIALLGLSRGRYAKAWKIVAKR